MQRESQMLRSGQLYRADNAYEIEVQNSYGSKFFTFTSIYVRLLNELTAAISVLLDTVFART